MKYECHFLNQHQKLFHIYPKHSQIHFFNGNPNRQSSPPLLSIEKQWYIPFSHMFWQLQKRTPLLLQSCGLCRHLRCCRQYFYNAATCSNKSMLLLLLLPPVTFSLGFVSVCQILQHIYLQAVSQTENQKVLLINIMFSFGVAHPDDPFFRFLSRFQ